MIQIRSLPSLKAHTHLWGATAHKEKDAMTIIIYNHMEKLQDEAKTLTTASRQTVPFALGHPNCEGQVIFQTILLSYRMLYTSKAKSDLWRQVISREYKECSLPAGLWRLPALGAAVPHGALCADARGSSLWRLTLTLTGTAGELQLPDTLDVHISINLPWVQLVPRHKGTCWSAARTK